MNEPSLLAQLKKFGTFIYKDPHPYEGHNGLAWVVSLTGRELSVSYGNLGNPYLCSQENIGIKRFHNDNDIIDYLIDKKHIFEHAMEREVNYVLYISK